MSIPFKEKNKEIFFNERIIEVMYLHRSIDFSKEYLILEVGPGHSWNMFELATFGHKLVGVGLKPEYLFKHPNITFYKRDIVDFKYKENFDYAIAISVLEHTMNRSKLQNIINTIYNNLKNDGIFIVTVPIGVKHIWKGFYEVFDYDDWMSYCKKFNLLHEELYIRKSSSLWEKTTKLEIKKTTLLTKLKYITGSNSVGCFCFQKA